MSGYGDTLQGISDTLAKTLNNIYLAIYKRFLWQNPVFMPYFGADN